MDSDLKDPTARIVNLRSGRAENRAEASAGGICRTESWLLNLLPGCLAEKLWCTIEITKISFKNVVYN